MLACMRFAHSFLPWDSCASHGRMHSTGQWRMVVKAPVLLPHHALQGQACEANGMAARSHPQVSSRSVVHAPCQNVHIGGHAHMPPSLQMSP